MKQLLRTCLAFTAAMIGTSSAHAIDLGEKAKYGKLMGDMRIRSEHFERDSKAQEATANTFRLRLGYMTPVWEGLSAYVEGETIQYIGNDNFDDGLNGHSAYPAVNDPHDNAMNQFYLSYVYPDGGHSIVLGRQVLQFDNQRWVGRSNWRQNDTTHDAARITLKPIKDMTFDYAYSINANRSMGTRQVLGEYEGEMHLVRLGYAIPSYDMKLAGYSYFLNFDDYINTLSSRTHGARLEWAPKPDPKTITPFGTLDIAQQSDMGSNPNNYSEWYGWYELGAAYKGYSLSAVHERLGGNGTAAVQSPLASLHSFNGWAEKFSTKPNTGLLDYYLVLKGPIPLPWEGHKLKFETQYHQFDAETTGDDIGHEWDLGFWYNPAEDHTIGLHMGSFYGDDPASSFDDAMKAWLFYEMKF